MALRFDASTATKVTPLPTGGIRVEAALARTGIQVYRNPDGSERREYRPPAEVFRADALAALRHAPVVYLHPPEGRVSRANWRRLAVGHVGEDVRADEGAGLVLASILVQDEDTIERINAGVRDVSLGYEVDFDPTPGVAPDGQRYDGVQRNIRPNHAAIVPVGRAGSEVGLRLDAAGDQVAPALCYATPIPDAGKPRADQVETPKPMQKIKIGGKEYEAGSAEAQTALDALQSRLDAAEKAQADAAKAAKVQALRAELAEAGIRVDAAGSSEEIMAEVLKKHAPGVSVEGASPDFVLGAFSAVLSLKLGAAPDAAKEPEAESDDATPAEPPAAGAPPRADAADPVLAAVKSARAARPAPVERFDAGEGGAADEARQKMIKRESTRHKVKEV